MLVDSTDELIPDTAVVLFPFSDPFIPYDDRFRKQHLKKEKAEVADTFFEMLQSQ